MQAANLFVGCAGWSVPARFAAQFAAGGRVLARYAGRFRAVEINSSFHRPHRGSTYARWAGTVPEHFIFAVKVPREITHVRRLAAPALLESFVQQVGALGTKLGPLLVQLPPRLEYDAAVAASFFSQLRACCEGQVVCEPRHPSWFTPRVQQLWEEYRVARAGADPSPVPEGGTTGGWQGLAYYRLHGSPRRYFSSYTPDFLMQMADRLRQHAVHGPVWCIFDNTASGAAIGNALDLLGCLAEAS